MGTMKIKAIFQYIIINLLLVKFITMYISEIIEVVMIKYYKVFM